MSPDRYCYERVAAASTCPRPDCGALTITYRFVETDRLAYDEFWDFLCSRCGMDFSVAEDELIFHSLPKSWLSGEIFTT